MEFSFPKESGAEKLGSFIIREAVPLLISVAVVFFTVAVCLDRIDEISKTWISIILTAVVMIGNFLYRVFTKESYKTLRRETQKRVENFEAAKDEDHRQNLMDLNHKKNRFVEARTQAAAVIDRVFAQDGEPHETATWLRELLSEGTPIPEEAGAFFTRAQIRSDEAERASLNQQVRDLLKSNTALNTAVTQRQIRILHLEAAVSEMPKWVKLLKETKEASPSKLKQEHLRLRLEMLNVLRQLHGDDSEVWRTLEFADCLDGFNESSSSEE